MDLATIIASVSTVVDLGKQIAALVTQFQVASQTLAQQLAALQASEASDKAAEAKLAQDLKI